MHVLRGVYMWSKTRRPQNMHSEITRGSSKFPVGCFTAKSDGKRALDGEISGQKTGGAKGCP